MCITHLFQAKPYAANARAMRPPGRKAVKIA